MNDSQKNIVQKVCSSPVKEVVGSHIFRSMQGHTLMEVLAALGLSAMVVGAALSLLQTTRQHGRHLIDTAQQRLDAYAALSVLAVHGRLAGYGMVRASADSIGMPEAASGESAKAPRKLARDDSRLAVFGDLGDAWSGVQRRAEAPQPVPGSERLKLRYLADKASVWLSTKDMPQNCEGVDLWCDTGLVVDANMQVLADAMSGEPSLHCATDAWRAGGPLVPSTGSMQFAYWLTSETQPRGLKEMTEEDWVRVIGFDVCLTMQDAARKHKSRAARGIGPRSSNLSSQRMRNGNDASSNVEDGVGAARCRGPHQYHRTIALRNKLHSEAVLRSKDDK